MSRLFDRVAAPNPESLLTHPSSQVRLAAQVPWWGWVAVGLAFVMAGLMVWYLWPRRPPKEPELPRDENGNLIPPWQWQEKGIQPPG